MTEREKMDAGLWYDANFDPQLLAARRRADQLCADYNALPPGEDAGRLALLRTLIPDLGEGVTILSPFYADYGSNCRIGDGCFLNHGVYLMDGAPITLGKRCGWGATWWSSRGSPSATAASSARAAWSPGISPPGWWPPAAPVGYSAPSPRLTGSHPEPSGSFAGSWDQFTADRNISLWKQPESAVSTG